MKVMIGGGCGFIGSALATSLVSHGFWVTSVDNLSSGHPLRIKSDRFAFEKGDLSSGRFVQKTLKAYRPDVFVYVAGQPDPDLGWKDPETDLSRTGGTILETLVALEAQPPGHFVLISTGEAFGGETKEPIEEKDRPDPDNPYGASHLLAESYLSLYARKLRMPFSILRISPVYGPGQGMDGEAGIFAAWARDFLSKDSRSLPKLTGNGGRTRDFLYLDDAVEGIACVIRMQLEGLFHMGAGKEVSERDVFTIFRSIMGSSCDYLYEGRYLSNTNKRIFSHRKLSDATGWEPEVPIEEGIRKTIEWFRRWVG